MKHLSIGLLLCLSIAPLFAANDLAFRGVLIEPPPCTINSGIAIDVDFGARLGVNKVNGVNYMQDLNYSISCSAGSAPWSMRLTLEGAATGYDSAAVETNMAGLGLHFMQASKPFPLNTQLPVDPKNLPRLQVVPVKMPGATLSEGAFNATATLQADFL